MCLWRWTRPLGGGGGGGGWGFHGGGGWGRLSGRGGGGGGVRGGGLRSVRLLLDQHDDLVRAGSGDRQRLRWHLHDLYQDLDPPTGALDRAVWLDRIMRRLRQAEQTTRVRMARDVVSHIRAYARQIRLLKQEIKLLVDELCPRLVAEPGCGPLTAAKLLGEIA